MAILDLQQFAEDSAKTELLTSLFSKMRGLSFGDLLDTFAAKESRYLPALRSMTTEDILAFAATATAVDKKDKHPAVDVPAIESFTKNEVARKAWKDEALALLVKTQMGDSRGLSPASIREALGRASDGQGRDLLAEMVEAGSVVHTGVSKGRKYVVTALKSQAEAVAVAEQVTAKAKEEKAKAAKAVKEAATTTATNTPVPATETKTAGKAKPPATKV